MGYTHGIKWSDELVVSEINKVRNILSIDRMPTRSEIDEVLGNSGLTNRIIKTGGFREWAERLQLNKKLCDSETGYKYEQFAMKLLKEKGYKVEKMSTQHPYDLLIDDSVKVDIKVSNIGYVEGSRVHTFRLAKKNATCDIYILFALNYNEEVEKLLIIPSHKLKITTLCMGQKSKYNKYIDKWEYIKKLTETYLDLC